MLVVSIQQLSKSYSAVTEYPDQQSATGRLTILDSIDLEIAANEFVVFVGRSGSGKSTLLNLIGAMDTPDKGKIQVDEQDITKLNEKQRAVYRRNAVGFIFQAYNLIPTLTVEENLQLPLTLTNNPDLSLATRYLKLLGLSARKNHWPDQLSGGEQQRVAIIRALIHHPKLILADEPTGNLDDANAKSVISLLTSMVKEHGLTLLLATHDLSICDVADRVFRIEAGTLQQLK